ncbi:MAG: tetratricopeptide repeat protein [Phycisphaeraceae bacterium]
MHQRHLPVICALSLVLAPLSGCGPRPTGPGNPDAKARPAVTVPAEQQEKARVWSNEGERLKNQGFTAQALAAFNQAIDENPRLTEAHLGIGDIYREREVFDKADQAYRRAVVSDPNNFDARYYLGLTNHLQGKLDQAIASYQRALRIDPKSYLANRDMGSAILQSGRPSDSIAYAMRAVEINPESQPGWANLAAAYSLTGDYDKAVEAYRQTLELGEPAMPILLGLADAHIKLGNYQRAENVLRAIEREGGDPIARERMGLVLFKQRKFDAASAAYRAALKDTPNDTAALNGMGVSLMAVYLRDGEEDEELRREALALWRRSLQLRPEQGALIDLISRYTKE